MKVLTHDFSRRPKKARALYGVMPATLRSITGKPVSHLAPVQSEISFQSARPIIQIGRSMTTE